MARRLKSYYPYVRPVRKYFGWALVFGIISAAANGFGLAFMIDRVFPVIFPGEGGALANAPGWLIGIVGWLVGQERVEEFLLYGACAMLPIIFVIRGAAEFGSSYLIQVTGTRILEAVRVALFDRLQRLSLSLHQEHREGDLVSRILNDTNQLQNVMVAVSANLVIQPLTLMFAVGFLVFKSIENTSVLFILIAMGSVPLCVVPVRVVGRKLLLKARKSQEKMGDVTAFVAENLASQQELRSYNQEDVQVARFRTITDHLVRAMLKVVKYRLITPPVIEILAALGIGVAIYFGARQEMTLNDFLPLIVAFYMSYGPVKILGRMQNQIRQGEASLNRIEELLHAEDPLKDPDDPEEFGEVSGEVVFEGVRFSYGEEPTLDRIDLRIAPGEQVALVGESGAGKTTFVALIPRFYDASEGMIRVGALDVRRVLRRDLRDQIALVSQHPILFRGTVRENILMGRPDARDDEVREAARNAFADEFIKGLPGAYECELGDRGYGLSGGQRQRIAIARAFLKDAPILILDEATSALDTNSEAQIHDALVRLSRGRTTIMIAHRFSSIRSADRIVVFEKGEGGGRVTGDGSHDELMRDHAHYRNLYTRQMSRENTGAPGAGEGEAE